MTDLDTVKANGTLLKFTGIGIPPYSCRGATQTLQAIAQAAVMKRTLNGHLRDISQAEFRKYASTITCTDQQAPAFGGTWQGQVVTIECVAELCYLTATGTPERPVVAGSSREEGAFTFYRPQLEMMIIDFKESLDEWLHDTQWTLSLEEV